MPYTFEVTFDDWPTSGPARKVVVTITAPTGEVTTLRLGAAELRNLLEVVATGLGYTKVSRPRWQHHTTWLEEIGRRVEPIMVSAKGAFPNRLKKAAVAAKKKAA